MEARRQYGIGFNFVPWGDVIEKGATNIVKVFKKKQNTKYVCLLPLLQKHILDTLRVNNFPPTP